MNELLAAHRHTRENRTEVEASSVCGCCSCVQMFAPDEIVAWAGLDLSDFDNPETQDGATAICPRCGNEAVLGDRSGYPINPSFLSRMNVAWFQTTIIRRPPPKA